MQRIQVNGCLTAALVSTVLFSCGKEKEPPAPLIRPVRYVQVFATGGSQERTFSGISKAALESRLSFKVPGTISRVGVKVGDRVKAGEMIAELDSKDYELQVQEAEASQNRAEAQARNAEANYSRVRALYENHNASRNDLDAARAGAESDRALVKSAQKRLELVRLQLSYTQLASPVEGSIASLNVEENENVSPGQPIALITSGSQLEVEVAIPEGLIAQIREADPVSITFDAIPNESLSGTVTEVGVSSIGMATTYPVVATLNQYHPDSRPGMAAEVAFLFGTPGGGNVIVVPSVAVGEDQDGRFVYTVQPADPGYGFVQRRVVTVGKLTSDGFEILDGLADGDRVITAGVSQIADGLRVKI